MTPTFDSAKTLIATMDNGEQDAFKHPEITTEKQAELQQRLFFEPESLQRHEVRLLADLLLDSAKTIPYDVKRHISAIFNMALDYDYNPTRQAGQLPPATLPHLKSTHGVAVGYMIKEFYENENGERHDPLSPHPLYPGDRAKHPSLLPSDELYQLIDIEMLAGLIHDVGCIWLYPELKNGIVVPRMMPPELLYKRGDLTDFDKERFKYHPVNGLTIYEEWLNKENIPLRASRIHTIIQGIIVAHHTFIPPLYPKELIDSIIRTIQDANERELIEIIHDRTRALIIAGFDYIHAGLSRNDQQYKSNRNSTPGIDPRHSTRTPSGSLNDNPFVKAQVVVGKILPLFRQDNPINMALIEAIKRMTGREDIELDQFLPTTAIINQICSVELRRYFSIEEYRIIMGVLQATVSDLPLLSESNSPHLRRTITET